MNTWKSQIPVYRYFPHAQHEVKAPLRVMENTLVTYPEVIPEAKEAKKAWPKRAKGTTIEYYHNGQASAVYRLSERQDREGEYRYYFSHVIDGPTCEEMQQAMLEYIWGRE